MVTVFINSLIVDYIVRLIVRFQAYSTFTQINVSIAQKLSILMFLNSALALLLVHIIYTKNIYGPGGLVYTVFYFFFSNAVVPAGVSLVNPMHRLKRLQFKYYYHKTRQYSLTQNEANKLLEYPEHEIEQGYADVVKTLIITFFFGPMLPIGYLVSFTGIIAFYFAEKYMLIRKKAVLHCPSFELSSTMTYSLSLLPIVYSFSNFMFKYYVSLYFPWISVLSFILSLCYFFLPSD